MSETGLNRRQLLLTALAVVVAPVGILMAGTSDRRSQPRRFCRIWRTYKPIPARLLTRVGTTDGNLTITKVSVSKAKRNGSRTYRDIAVWYKVEA